MLQKLPVFSVRRVQLQLFPILTKAWTEICVESTHEVPLEHGPIPTFAQTAYRGDNDVMMNAELVYTMQMILSVMIAMMDCVPMASSLSYGRSAYRGDVQTDCGCRIWCACS